MLQSRQPGRKDVLNLTNNVQLFFFFGGGYCDNRPSCTLATLALGGTDHGVFFFQVFGGLLKRSSNVLVLAIFLRQKKRYP